MSVASLMDVELLNVHSNSCNVTVMSEKVFEKRSKLNNL